MSVRTKIDCNFVQFPNHLARGGHGAINIAVLLAMISRGDCWASIETIAKDVGCDVKSVRKAINYWIEDGKKAAVSVEKTVRKGQTTSYSFFIGKETPTENGSTPLPKTVGVPLPKTVGEEYYLKNTPEESARASDEASRSVKEVMTKKGKNTGREKEDQPLSREQFISSLESSPRKDFHVLAAWAKATRPELATRLQWNQYLRRNLRAASQLAPFSEEQLRAAFHEIEKAQEKGWLTKPTLETLQKFVLK